MTNQETDIIEQFSLAVENNIEIIIELIKSYFTKENGYTKIAVFLYSIGEKSSVEIYRYLTEEEIEEITFHVACLQTIDVIFRNETLKEFYEYLSKNQFLEIEGINYARTLLERSLGSTKAVEIVYRYIDRLEDKYDLHEHRIYALEQIVKK